MENYLYYDLDLYNDQDQKIPVRFSDKRSDNKIQNVQKYFFSITRFSLSTLCLPVFIPLMGTTQVTKYSFTYDTDANTYNAVHVPYSATATVPSQLLDNYENDEYYYYYSYGQVLEMFNNMFKSKSGVDPITLSLNNMFLEINIPANYKQVYFNKELKILFSLFNYKKINNNKYQLIYEVNINTPQKLVSENTIGYLFSPVSSISFISESVPIRSTLKSNNENIITNKTKRVMTDFISASDGLNLFTPNLVYIPSIYRFDDIELNGDLKDMSFKVQWVDKKGNFHDLYLEENQSCSLKILFKRKGVET
jgi:hypothetical protein